MNHLYRPKPTFELLWCVWNSINQRTWVKPHWVYQTSDFTCIWQRKSWISSLNSHTCIFFICICIHTIIHYNTNMHTSGQNIGPQRVYNTRLRARNMEDEECAYREAHFQEELDSLKVSVARLTSLLEQLLKNASSEGLFNRRMMQSYYSIVSPTFS